MEIVVIGTGEFDRWVADLGPEPLTVLVGSAISQFASADGTSLGLPSGRTLSKQLARLLSCDAGPTGQIVCDLIENAAFEHIMEACPYREQLRDRLASRFNSRRANDLHLAVAELVRGGRVRHVITTNYDRCLDTALLGLAHTTIISEPTTATDFSRPTYFKIHGCASQSQTLVFTLSGEKKMDLWKRSILRELVPARLLIVGYSGRDFELCPELAELGCALAWNCFTAPSASELLPSAYAIRLLEKAGSVALVGSMTDLFPGLGTSTPAVKDDPGVALPDEEFLWGTDERERRRSLDGWRCQLFRHIGCSHAGRWVADRLLDSSVSAEERSEALHFRGLALFHGGKYKQAAAAYQEAAILTSADEPRLGRLFDAVEALRCGGFTVRATSLLTELERDCPEERYVPPLLVRRLLLLVQRVQVLRKTFRSRVAEQLAAEGFSLADRLEEAATRLGFHIELAQCHQLRLVLQGQAAAQKTPPGLLSASDRYHQLGYLVAEAAAIRIELPNSTGHVAGPRLWSIAEMLHHLGARAEMWKFGLTAVVAGGLTLQDRLRLFLRVVRNCWQCEYTMIHRIFLLSQHAHDSLHARRYVREEPAG